MLKSGDLGWTNIPVRSKLLKQSAYFDMDIINPGSTLSYKTDLKKRKKKKISFEGEMSCTGGSGMLLCIFAFHNPSINILLFTINRINKRLKK